jgi:outer membrane biosynthesis protein TonB
MDQWKKIAAIAAVSIGGVKGVEYTAPMVTSAVRSYFVPVQPETCWRFSLEVVDGKIVSNALAINVSNGVPPAPKPQPEPEPIKPTPQPEPVKPVEPKPEVPCANCRN